MTAGTGLFSCRIADGAAMVTAADRAAHVALADRAIEANPFHHIGALEAASVYVGPFDLHWIARDGRVLAALPVQRAAMGFGLGGIVPQSLTSNLAPLGTPMMGPDASAEDIGRLLRAAMTGGAAMAVPCLHLGGAVAERLSAAAEVCGLVTAIARAHERPALTAPRAPDAYFAGEVDGGRMKKLRNLRRRLEKSGPVTYSAIGAGDGLAAALEAMMALEASGWKGTARTALACDPKGRDFTLRLAAALAPAGQLRVEQLTSGDRVVASQIALIMGGRYHIWKTAYAEDLAVTSPGVQLAVDSTRQALADPSFMAADSLSAPGPSLLSPIWADRFAFGTLVLANGPTRLQLLTADARFYDRVKATAKRVLRR